MLVDAPVLTVASYAEGVGHFDIVFVDLPASRVLLPIEVMLLVSVGFCLLLK